MILQLMEERQSCRNFDAAKSVCDETLDKILGAGMLSPSARNAQPWTFNVCRGETAAAVRQACQVGGANAFLDNCGTFVVVTERGGAFRAPELPPQMAEVTRQDFRMLDIGLAVQAMCLAACEEGLATCIIGWFSMPSLCKAVNTEEPARIVVAVGYAAENDVLRVKNRRAKEDSVKYFC